MTRFINLTVSSA